MALVDGSGCVWLWRTLKAALKLASETRSHKSLSRHYVIIMQRRPSELEALKRWMGYGDS